MSLFDEFNKDESNSPVQSKGPAVLLPAEAIGNVVTKTNTLILEHRDWLANLPRRKERIKRQSDEISPPRSLITPAPSLKHSAINPFVPRQNLVLPECNSISSSAFSAGVIAGAASASTQLQSSILSAQSAFASAQLSAAIALRSVLCVSEWQEEHHGDREGYELNVTIVRRLCLLKQLPTCRSYRSRSLYLRQ